MQCYTVALHKRLVSAPVHAGKWLHIEEIVQGRLHDFGKGDAGNC